MIIGAIRDYGVTHINFVPSMLNVFIEVIIEENIKELNKLRYIFVAGEAISRKTVDKFRQNIKSIRLENIRTHGINPGIRNRIFIDGFKR